MRLVVASLLVAVGLMLMSCGGIQSTTSGSQTASVAATPPPSVGHTAQAGWAAYISARWGYSIEYPTRWYDVPNHGAPDTQKYFSNENVGAPLQMSASGVWETIDVEPNQSEPCAPPWASNMAVRQSPITLDGVPTTRYVVNFTPSGTEASYMVGVWVGRGGRCYGITFQSQNPSARDANIDVDDQAIASFRFGPVV
jgi:hypothetical protein